MPPDFRAWYDDLIHDKFKDEVTLDAITMEKFGDKLTAIRKSKQSKLTQKDRQRMVKVLGDELATKYWNQIHNLPEDSDDEKDSPSKVQTMFKLTCH